MKISGSELVAKALSRQGVDSLFYIMGGPNMAVLGAIAKEPIRMIDVRHEQAAAMMAQAYARLLNRPGVCMAASGPGVTNLVTGIANAHIDGAPIVALGGSSPVSGFKTGAFQEVDQVAMMRPITKWAERVYDARRIPEYIALAFSHATAGKPGPVYLDMPGDVLYAEVEEDAVVWPTAAQRPRPRPAATRSDIDEVCEMLSKANRPVVISGTGIFWSGAAGTMQRTLEALGIPFYTTPQGRGALPDDHALSFPSARSVALREADLVIVVGTRLNYIWGHGQSPRFARDAKFVRVDIDPEELAGSLREDIRIQGDAGVVLQQIAEAAASLDIAPRFAAWRSHLAEAVASRQQKQDTALASDNVPIHPLRLCREVRDFMDRDAVLVVDGQETLNYARQSIPTFVAAHRLNSGPFGTMGVGLPFGVGAKVARPDHQVIVLHGDGSFGLNAMELDTAVRHKLPLLVVISLNGGWTADPTKTKAGRDLGYTRFDLLAQSLGCHGEYVSRPEDIRPALERAKEQVRLGKVALVNVETDWAARATTAEFTKFTT